ncbi:MAG TPA: twin-arginine translocation signal domain-containing protein, partial [Pyrinomonadaceae bacterium]
MQRRDFIKALTFSTAGLVIAPSFGWAQGADPWRTEYPRILARIKPPKFPKRDFSILKYGAKEGGEVDCRDAINKAIEAANKAGGGRVVVPMG